MEQAEAGWLAPASQNRPCRRFEPLEAVFGCDRVVRIHYSESSPISHLLAEEQGGKWQTQIKLFSSQDQPERFLRVFGTVVPLLVQLDRSSGGLFDHLKSEGFSDALAESFVRKPLDEARQMRGLILRVDVDRQKSERSNGTGCISADALHHPVFVSVVAVAMDEFGASAFEPFGFIVIRLHSPPLSTEKYNKKNKKAQVLRFS